MQFSPLNIFCLVKLAWQNCHYLLFGSSLAKYWSLLLMCSTFILFHTLERLLVDCLCRNVVLLLFSPLFPYKSHFSAHFSTPLAKQTWP